ncbi:AGR058Wp [Eremothecium gossypii ATCC 10895]|uniref:non-specific serine/threonine protein kinase n=1 Tax=Eremothecium gossypii (strain ATCC 10895 / CBS 109.51 / FGSC 9923 / NRRL Y-1056) TaxID=284811 RepID=Q74ZZ9_EREGS|nr:AGR058Wp [Eremothecium gossypii ATCC 10895]AAS54547.2 AGR058Wp [Eremothecium gossypii ATCC 10895]AEY98879.1 FAGR058Wp [Eremothecium gossypii FDAG1]
MPSSTQDYHVNSQFRMGGSPQAAVAPATPRMMGKAGEEERRMPKPFHRKSLGDWDFLETVGAGSMGKVKLAKHRYTNELCAIKIVNRATKSFMHKQQLQGLPPPATEEELLERRKKLEKEVSRDKRTIREASLGQILYHPHICRLFEMCTMSNHFYMLFEYVSGGQLLDYIIQHGSLRERHARKFARGIASALQYLHLNNIVHRDLKIENIMISSSGEIRIIDFGLSNMYDPKKQLHTFCGSLYFAAPELLKAHPYTGPEVDIWSFGVVLYVLVCGKVPFDDENASVLHEKIKQGKVEYPQHLSIDVISLLSKMLVVDPYKRATLKQVVHHQWMQKGYDFPPPSYLPPCVPLTPDRINMDIITEMYRLELIHDVAETAQWLEKIITSPEYLELSRQYWENAANMKPEDAPIRGYSPLLSMYHLVDEMLKRKRSKMQKRGQASAQTPATAGANSGLPSSAALISADTTSAGSYASTAAGPQKLAAAVTPENSDRMSGPHVLVSQLDSEKSRTLQPAVSPHDETSSTYITVTTPSKQKQNVLVPPRLAIPEQAHTTTPRKAINVDGEIDQKVLSPTPQSHDFETSNKYSTTSNATHSAAVSAGSTEKQNFGSLFRRFSQRHRHTTSQGGSQCAYHPEVNTLQSSAQYQTSKTSTQAAKTKTHTRTVSEYTPASKYANMGPPAAADSTRSTTNYLEARSPLPALPVNAESLVKEQQRLQDNLQGLDISGGGQSSHANNNRNSTSSYNNNGPEVIDEDKPLRQLSVPKGRKLHPSARAKSVGHARRESLKFMRPAIASQLSPQDINDEGFLEQGSDTESENIFGGSSSGAVASVDEELTDKQILELAARAPPGSMPSIDYPRSLFLKGFFSVQTTSSKPLPIVRYKIISTLKKLNIEFKEVKGGFVCVHRQSYMTNRASPTQPNIFVTDSTSITSSTNGTASSTHRRQLSVPSRHNSLRRQQQAGANNLGTSMHERTSSTASHSIAGSGCITEELSTASLESLHGDDILTTSKAQHMNTKDLEMQLQKERPPLKFEIHIVKVRIVGLAGVHFKKVSGNTWMYKELASHILKELNL